MTASAAGYRQDNKKTAICGLFEKDLRISDLLEQPFITSDRDIGYCASLERELTRRGMPFSPVMEIGSVEGIVNVLLGGYGVSFIPEYMAARHIEDEELIKLDVKDISIDQYTYCVTSKERWINPVMQEFIRIINES